jgi:hypothetical protein
VAARATRRRTARRSALTALSLVALALSLAACGGSASIGDGFTPSPGSTAPTQPPPGSSPTTPTIPGQPPRSSHRYSPPPIAVVPGHGPQIGATARARFAVGSHAFPPPGFIPGGIPVGSRSGICHVPTILAGDLTSLEAATKHETPRGRVLPLSPDTILLADCGSAGLWAMITWTQVHDGRTTYWTDELRDAGSRWIGTARFVQPGCRMPRDAAALWQLDVTVCGPPRAPRPPRRPATPTPIPTLPGDTLKA